MQLISIVRDSAGHSGIRSEISSWNVTSIDPVNTAATRLPVHQQIFISVSRSSSVMLSRGSLDPDIDSVILGIAPKGTGRNKVLDLAHLLVT